MCDGVLRLLSNIDKLKISLHTFGSDKIKINSLKGWDYCLSGSLNAMKSSGSILFENL